MIHYKYCNLSSKTVLSKDETEEIRKDRFKPIGFQWRNDSLADIFLVARRLNMYITIMFTSASEGWEMFFMQGNAATLQTILSVYNRKRVNTKNWIKDGKERINRVWLLGRTCATSLGIYIMSFRSFLQNFYMRLHNGMLNYDIINIYATGIIVLLNTSINLCCFRIIQFFKLVVLFYDL